MPDHITLSTSDGVAIAGDLYKGRAAGPAALLSHMMPATKESWAGFAQKLVAVGFSTVLAIDLRGHGQSTKQGSATLDYHTFTDADHQAALNDLEAAIEWLKSSQAADENHLALVGASIGANLSIVAASHHPAIPAVAALSAGLDYHGVTTESAVAAFASHQKLFLAASDDDPYAFSSSHTLAKTKSDTLFKTLIGAGHGTAMFDSDPVLADQLADWLITTTS